MTFDLAAILESKRQFRQRLAERPIVEKLALLDVLRERQLAIRGPADAAQSGILREESPSYRVKSE
jgi:hypothetical protein